MVVASTADAAISTRPIGVQFACRMPTDHDPDKKKSPWVQFGRYSQLAFMLPAGTVAGYLIGSLFDRWLHKNWISVVGLVLGTAGGLIEVIRMASKDTK